MTMEKMSTEPMHGHYVTTRPKQLFMAATARVIWLCACVRYWPDRELVFECVTCFYCYYVTSIFSVNTGSVRQSSKRLRQSQGTCKLHEGKEIDNHLKYNFQR